MDEHDKDLRERFKITQHRLLEIQHSLHDYEIFFGIGDNLTVYYENKKFFKKYIQKDVTKLLIAEGVKEEQINHEFCGRMELY